MKQRLFDKQQGNCALCKLPLILEMSTIDHIVPRAKKGKNQESNYQLVHSICNQIKGTALYNGQPVASCIKCGAILRHEDSIYWHSRFKHTIWDLAIYKSYRIERRKPFNPLQ